MEHKILVIWDRIGDYHAARIKALADLIGNQNVFSAELGSGDSLYKWQNQILNNQHFILSRKPIEKFDIWNRTINFVKIVKKYKIKTVSIPGYSQVEYIIFLIISKLLGLKIIFFAESWYIGNKWNNFVKRLFLKMINPFFFVSGQKAENYFCNVLRINTKYVKKGYSVVDNSHFENIRLPDSYNNKILLCVARLSPEKNLISLINCFIKSNISSTWQLIIVGDGPQREKILEKTKNYKKINICKWASYNELPKIYKQASMFILPSTFEPWGLVVNEAMAAGLPIIASKQCGCVPDLVDDSNGFTFDANNENELIEILNNLQKADIQEFALLGTNSQNKIKNFTPFTWASKIYEFIN